MSCLLSPRSCCFCVDHLEGVKVTGILFFVANCLLLAEQVVVLAPIGIVLQVVLALASLCLVVGAVRRIRPLILLWVVSYALAVVGLVAYEIYWSAEEQNWLYLVIVGLAVPLMLYALLVVISLYRRLGDHDDEISGYVSV